MRLGTLPASQCLKTDRFRMMSIQLIRSGNPYNAEFSCGPWAVVTEVLKQLYEYVSPMTR